VAGVVPALAAMLAIPAVPAFGACPESRICCHCYWDDICGDCTVSSLPQLDRYCEHPFYGGFTSGSYDLVAGHVRSSAFGWFDGDNSGLLVAVDEFTIHDAQGSGPRPVTLLLRLSVYLQESCTVHASLAHQGAKVEYSKTNMTEQTVSFEDSLELEIEVTPGIPFTVEYALGSQGIFPRAAEVDGHLKFKSADAVTVESCQGYGSSPVPGGRTTWGAVKSLYR
jgi:hypothetical protein